MQDLNSTNEGSSPASATTTPAVWKGKMLYLFSGPLRPADGFDLYCRQLGFQCQCVDTEISPSHNLLDVDVAERCLTETLLTMTGACCLHLAALFHQLEKLVMEAPDHFGPLKAHPDMVLATSAQLKRRRSGSGMHWQSGLQMWLDVHKPHISPGFWNNHIMMPNVVRHLCSTWMSFRT